MTKVNRYNGQQRRTQNLAQHKKQHKPLEVGQTLTQQAQLIFLNQNQL